MQFPGTELAAAFALFVGAPLACAVVCVWALRSDTRQPVLSRVHADAGFPAASAAVVVADAPLPPPRAAARRARLLRAATALRARLDFGRWLRRRAAAQVDRAFLACFDDEEQAALRSAFAETVTQAERSADVQVQRTLTRLRDGGVPLTVVSPPQGAGAAVLLVFADATALVATPQQRDAARLLAAELWSGPVLLRSFLTWDESWTLRFATPSAEMPLTVRELLPG